MICVELRIEGSNEAGQATGDERDIPIVGGGPAGLVTAIALTRRGVRTTLFERDVHPDRAPRVNADRSYTIDIAGHGPRSLRCIDATSYFDDRMLALQRHSVSRRVLEGWDEPRSTGSRGGIVRTLIAVATDSHAAEVDSRFECSAQALMSTRGRWTYPSPRGGAADGRRFGLVIGRTAQVRSSGAHAGASGGPHN